MWAALKKSVDVPAPSLTLPELVELTVSGCKQLRLKLDNYEDANRKGTDAAEAERMRLIEWQKETAANAKDAASKAEAERRRLLSEIDRLRATSANSDAWKADAEEASKLRGELDTARRERDAAAAKLKALEGQMSEGADARAAQLAAEAEQARSQLSKARGERDGAIEERNQLRKELDSSQSHADVLQEKLSELEAGDQHVKKLERELKDAKKTMEALAAGSGDTAGRARAKAEAAQREVERLLLENEELQEALREAISKQQVSGRRNDYLVDKVEDLELRFRKAEKALEGMARQLGHASEEMVRAMEQRAMELERVTIDANTRVRQVEEGRKRERSALVKEALTSLTQLRSYLTLTLGALKVKTSTTEEAEALDAKLEDGLTMREKWQSQWLNHGGGAPADAVVVSLLPPVSVKAYPEAFHQSPPGKLQQAPSARLPRVSSMPSIAPPSQHRSHRGKDLAGTAAPYQWPIKQTRARTTVVLPDL